MPTAKMGDGDPLGLRSSAVCSLLNLPSSTLNYWVQLGLVSPSIRGPQGRRVEQYWSVEDVVVVRAIRQLRQAGASLQQVRKVAKRLTEWGSAMNNARLYWDGEDVLVETNTGELLSGLEHPGQLTWFLIALPLGTWHAQTTKRARPVDLSTIRDRDKARQKAVLARAQPLESLVRKSDESA
jgi:DNA-binding transcriptional MerR regulator